MKTWITMFALFLLIGGMTTSGCGKDDKDDPDTCAEGWQNAYLDEYQKFVDAANMYSTDPTTENCQAYKTALLDYIDAYKKLENCFFNLGQIEAFRANVQQAEQEAEMIQC